MLRQRKGSNKCAAEVVEGQTIDSNLYKACLLCLNLLRHLLYTTMSTATTVVTCQLCIGQNRKTSKCLLLFMDTCLLGSNYTPDFLLSGLRGLKY